MLHDDSPAAKLKYAAEKSHALIWVGLMYAGANAGLGVVTAFVWNTAVLVEAVNFSTATTTPLGVSGVESFLWHLYLLVEVLTHESTW